MTSLLAAAALGITLYLFIKYPPLHATQRKWYIGLIIVLALLLLRVSGLWQAFLFVAVIAIAVVAGLYVYNAWKESKKPPTLP